MNISDISQIWIEDHEQYVKRSSISAYDLLLQNHILPFFGEMETVLEEDIQVYVNLKLKTLSKKTVKDTLIVLKMILKYGSKKGLYRLEKFDFDIIYPTDNNSVQKLDAHNKQNISKLTNYLILNFSFQNLALLIAIQTGMRIGEVCALQWCDIDLDNGIFNVEKTRQRIYVFNREKNKRETILITDSAKTSCSNREIPISKPILNIVKPLLKIVNKEYYICTNTGKGTEPRTFRNYYKLVLDQLDLPYIKFHGLRHTFATTCLANGIDIKTTSVLLGHANVSTTMNIYMHPGIEDKKKAINKLFK